MVMFSGADAFDQDIGGWDVSGGTSFVSNDQSVGLIRSLVLLCYPTRMQSQPITHVWHLKEQVLSSNLSSLLLELDV